MQVDTYAGYMGTFFALALLIFLLSRVFGHFGKPVDRVQEVQPVLVEEKKSFQVRWDMVTYVVVFGAVLVLCWFFILPYTQTKHVLVLDHIPHVSEDEVREWSIIDLFPTLRWSLGWYLLAFILAFIQSRLKMKYRTWGPAVATLFFGLLAAHILTHPWDVWIMEAAIFKDPKVYEYKTLITWIVGILVVWKALAWYFSTQDLGFLRPLPLTVILFFLFTFRACGNFYL